MNKITPLGKNVLIKLDEAEKVTVGGIILPEKNENEKSQQGQVVSVGNHKDVDSSIKPGAKVIFEKYEGLEVEINGDKLVIVKSKSILAILS